MIMRYFSRKDFNEQLGTITMTAEQMKYIACDECEYDTKPERRQHAKCNGCSPTMGHFKARKA